MNRAPGNDLTAHLPRGRSRRSQRSDHGAFCSTARWSPTTAIRPPSAGCSSSSVAGRPLPSLCRVPGRLLRLRPSRGRRRGPPRAASARAPRTAGGGGRAERRVAGERSLAGRFRAALQRGVPVGLGGADRQARRRAVQAAGRSKDWLKLKCAWEQEFVIGGFTDPPAAAPTSARYLSATTTGRLVTPARSAPATPRRPSRRSGAAACARDARVTVRRRAPFPAGRIGSARIWSPRSASPNGPATVVCVTRASSACADKGRPMRWSASARP